MSWECWWCRQPRQRLRCWWTSWRHWWRHSYCSRWRAPLRCLYKLWCSLFLRGGCKNLFTDLWRETREGKNREKGKERGRGSEGGMLTWLASGSNDLEPIRPCQLNYHVSYSPTSSWHIDCLALVFLGWRVLQLDSDDGKENRGREIPWISKVDRSSPRPPNKANQAVPKTMVDPPPSRGGMVVRFTMSLSLATTYCHTIYKKKKRRREREEQKREGGRGGGEKRD